MSPTPLLGGTLYWADEAVTPSEDAFWLAASVPELPPHTPVLDMACGNGAVGLSLLVRQPTLMLTGIDCDAAMLAEAKTNAAANQRTAIWQHADAFTTSYITPYPVVVCNPPFHSRAHGHESADPRKALAHGLERLADWVHAWHSALAENGRLYAILHADLTDGLIETITLLGGELWLAPMATHPERASKRILVCWRKSGLPFMPHILPVVPSYHSPLRQAVLYKAGALAVFPHH